MILQCGAGAWLKGYFNVDQRKHVAHQMYVHDDAPLNSYLLA